MFCQDKNAYETMTDLRKEEIFEFSEEYKRFLNISKTEREATSYFIGRATSAGFTELPPGKPLVPGDKLIFINRGKSLMLAVIGRHPISSGTNIIAAHIDSPRLDLKQNPLYEEKELALLKTHYYGGIKKYQWTAMPLALHGIVVTSSGMRVEVNIGEKPTDPVFTITDLLPHLAKEQLEKKLNKAIEGESLRLLFGSMPIIIEQDKEKEKIKRGILKILETDYGITDEDFTSAELEVVPAFKASDVGLDRSLIGAYGQDDRSCSFAAFNSIIGMPSPEKTALLILADKEEIGSMGNTGMQSHFFEDTIARLCAAGSEVYSDLMLRDALSSSLCLSADVAAAFDPNYQSAQDESNAPKLNHGVTITKYTGSGGKSGANDASAEFVGYLRQLFNNNNIAWQTGELGKVDLGGGGTVAQFLANLNIDVIDVGIPLLSMHSPFEVSSKLDLHMAFRAYSVFYSAF